jgi:hypothetical protein
MLGDESLEAARDEGRALGAEAALVDALSLLSLYCR